MPPAVSASRPKGAAGQKYSCNAPMRAASLPRASCPFPAGPVRRRRGRQTDGYATPPTSTCGERTRGGGGGVRAAGRRREDLFQAGEHVLKRRLQHRAQVIGERRRAHRESAVRGGREHRQRVDEVFATDGDGAGVDDVLLVSAQQLRVRVVQRAQRRLRAERLEIGAAVAMRAAGELGDEVGGGRWRP